MRIDGGVLRKDGVGSYFVTGVFFCVPAEEVIAIVRGRGQRLQLPTLGGGAGRCHTAAVGIKGHGALRIRLVLPTGIDGGVLREDGVGGYCISAVFFRVPAEEVIAIIRGGWQLLQLPTLGGGAGRCHAAAVGIKGHGVLRISLVLPTGIDGGVLCKDGVGSYFVTAVFFRVPAEEVIAIIRGSGQAFQLSAFSGGAGRCHTAAVGIKGYRHFCRRLGFRLCLRLCHRRSSIIVDSQLVGSVPDFYGNNGLSIFIDGNTLAVGRFAVNGNRFTTAGDSGDKGIGCGTRLSRYDGTIPRH